MRALNHLIASMGRGTASPLCYRVTDRLHDGRTVRVPIDGIGSVVAVWLSELGADSPLVDDLVCAGRCADWPTAHALAEHLSVDVTAAA